MMRLLALDLPSEIIDAARSHIACRPAAWDLHVLSSLEELGDKLQGGDPMLVLAGPGEDGSAAAAALRLIEVFNPEARCIGMVLRESDARALVEAGALDAFLPEQAWRLPVALQHASESMDRMRAARKTRGMEVLVDAVKRLSLARRMEDIVEIVRRAARRLSQADGATFVLRDGSQCHYVEEDAIGPLWRGCKFPLSNCISGWAMLNRKPAIVPDIYQDPRIPVDAYRPTFVKSLVMVPIRTESPIGAIGTYWARSRGVTEEELALIQALADSTALAVENVQFVADLERRVQERTASLEGANKELEAFSASVSHDLRSPLAVIKGFSELLLDPGRNSLSIDDQRMIQDISTSADRMQVLIEDLLRLSRVTKREVEFEDVDVTALVREILFGMAAAGPARIPELDVEEGLTAYADPGLLRIALENLLSNAWKYSSKRSQARIEVGSRPGPDGSNAIFVRDNGAGFDMAKAVHLFEPFQRLHTSREFPGTGIGLATVHRVVQKHGGKVWAESEKDKGATFRIYLPPSPTALPQMLLAAAAA